MPITYVYPSTFTDFVKEVNSRSKSISHLTLFRGQSSAEWKLLPRIARDEVDENFIKKEERLIREFKRLGRSLIGPEISKDQWDLLAFAQYHGLKTRLLDWTTNPLVALWFAYHEEPESDTNRAIWMLKVKPEDIVDTEEDSPYGGRVTSAFRPNHVTNRITAQSGWFTSHKYNSSQNKFIPLDNNSTYLDRLTKIEMKDGMRESVLKSLDNFGINHSTMFPDLGGLTTYLNWKRIVS